MFLHGHLIKFNPAVVTIFDFNAHFVKIIVHVPFVFNQVCIFFEKKIISPRGPILSAIMGGGIIQGHF